jgi:hypothetical protein
VPIRSVQYPHQLIVFSSAHLRKKYQSHVARSRKNISFGSEKWRSVTYRVCGQGSANTIYITCMVLHAYATWHDIVNIYWFSRQIGVAGDLRVIHLHMLKYFTTLEDTPRVAAGISRNIYLSNLKLHKWIKASDSNKLYSYICTVCIISVLHVLYLPNRSSCRQTIPREASCITYRHPLYLILRKTNLEESELYLVQR